MLGEYIFLGCLVIFAFGAAILAIKTKNSKVIHAESIDIQALAEAVAKAVGKEIAKELKEAMKNITVQNGNARYDYPNYSVDSKITMDESIIPVTVETQTVSSNLETMVKEEISIDKDLQKSKSKLSSLFKNKKGRS